MPDCERCDPLCDLRDDNGRRPRRPRYHCRLPSLTSATEGQLEQHCLALAFEPDQYRSGIIPIGGQFEGAQEAGHDALAGYPIRPALNPCLTAIEPVPMTEGCPDRDAMLHVLVQPLPQFADSGGDRPTKRNFYGDIECGRSACHDKPLRKGSPVGEIEGFLPGSGGGLTHQCWRRIPSDLLWIFEKLEHLLEALIHLEKPILVRHANAEMRIARKA